MLLSAIRQALNVSSHFKPSMTKLYSAFILTLSALPSFAQNKMRSVDELINKTEPGWTLVKQWIDIAKNKVEILPCDTTRAKDALYKTQVTTRSPMGAIIYSTGGLLVDNGWIRILGSGSDRLLVNMATNLRSFLLLTMQPEVSLHSTVEV
jgi:hypothetical protein